MVPHPRHLWYRRCTFHNLPRQDRQMAHAVRSKAQRVSILILASACCISKLTCSIVLVIIRLPGGWAIPIGILFVLSFPPLFGGEVICLLCGLVWGLWVGFGIVCAGTFIGEVSLPVSRRPHRSSVLSTSVPQMGNFFLFKYTLRGYAAKLERKNLNYALMAHVIREGGFKVGRSLPQYFSLCHVR